MSSTEIKKEYETYLVGAAEIGKLSLCKILIHILDSKFKDIDNIALGDALFLASKNGHTSICEFLIEKGANVNHVKKGEGSPPSCCFSIRKKRNL
jgi:hypothetical protein